MQPKDTQREQGGLEFGPGNWCEELLGGEQLSAVGRADTFHGYGEEVASEVLAKAQEWVSSSSVIIVTFGKRTNSNHEPAVTAGSGVIVQLGGGIYGLLTAAHVLSAGENRNDRAKVKLFARPRNWPHAGGIKPINLSPRSCTGVGFGNKKEKGPDLAVVPLSSEEWTRLEGMGLVAYNLDRPRWTDDDKAKLREMKPWCVSVISGLRFEASRIVQRHTDGNRLPLAVIATTTRVEGGGERGGYDFLELDSEASKDAYPTHWKSGVPGTAAEEIEQLHDDGVTRNAWGGTSGAGVWNLAIGTDGSGKPEGGVIGELAGICYYASPEKGCIIAHGPKSIRKIAAKHFESIEAHRVHSKT